MAFQLWDYLIVGILVLTIVMFLTGNGDRALSLFGGSKAQDMLDEYDLKKLSAATVIFCFVLLLSEILILAGDSLPFNTGIFSIVLSILSLAVYVFCLRKFCRK